MRVGRSTRTSHRRIATPRLFFDRGADQPWILPFQRVLKTFVVYVIQKHECRFARAQHAAQVFFVVSNEVFAWRYLHLKLIIKWIQPNFGGNLWSERSIFGYPIAYV